MPPIVCPNWQRSRSVSRSMSLWRPIRLACRRRSARDNDHTDRHGGGRRSNWRRTHAESGVARREQHRLLQYGRREGRKERRVVSRYVAIAASRGSSGQSGRSIHQVLPRARRSCWPTAGIEIAPVAMDVVESVRAHAGTTHLSRRCYARERVNVDVAMVFPVRTEGDIAASQPFERGHASAGLVVAAARHDHLAYYAFSRRSAERLRRRIRRRFATLIAAASSKVLSVRETVSMVRPR
jgi:hypothetical protein